MADLDLDALLSPAGQELLALLAAAPPAPGEELRVGAGLRARWPAALVAAAVAQQGLRVRARAKFARAERMLFTREGLEQASSEAAARHRARRFAGLARLADLCCGIGGDLAALAQGGWVLAADRDLTHVRAARHNAAVHGVAAQARPVCADVRDLRLGGLDGLFCDPARRGGRGGAVAARRLPAGASEPPLAWCLALAERVAAVAVKAAPGLALELVPDGWEVELVADGRDLKEAVLWSPALATAARRATVLPGGHTLVPAPGPPVPCAAPGGWLVDPNPAVTRAGLVEELARTLDAWKLDPRIAFLSCDREPRTPFGRTLRVEASMPFHERRLREALRALGVGALDVRRRGLAGDVDALRRRLKLAGRARATLAMTRLHGRPWALVCSDPADPPLG